MVQRVKIESNTDRRSRYWRSVLVGVVLTTAMVLVPSLVLAASDCNIDSVITALEKAYHTADHQSFTFAKRTISSVFGDTVWQEGQVWLGPKGTFRVETPQETMVNSGDTLWHWVPAYNQVTVRIPDSLTEFRAPVHFIWSLRRDFLKVDCKIDSLDGEMAYRIRLAAKAQTAAIQRLTLWVRPGSATVQKAAYIDYNDDHIELELSPLISDPTGSATRFSLQVPDSAEVFILPQKKR